MPRWDLSPDWGPGAEFTAGIYRRGALESWWAPQPCSVEAMGAMALLLICGSSFTREDHNTIRAHPWGPFPSRRAIEDPVLKPHSSQNVGSDAERIGNILKGLEYVRTENGSIRGQNLALSVFLVPNSLDRHMCSKPLGSGFTLRPHTLSKTQTSLKSSTLCQGLTRSVLRLGWGGYAPNLSAFERKRSNLTGFKDLCLRATARIWS
jgi:hypothetical protein